MEPRDEEPPWEQVPEILRGFAEVDLRSCGEVTPCLAAYAGTELLCFGFVRAFAKGGHHDPIREMLAAVMALGADHLGLSMGARIWSLDDPIPPVLEGVGDLRQRVVMVHRVDATPAAGGAARCEAWPYDIDDGVVRWLERFAPPGPVEGWVNRSLEAAVRGRAWPAEAGHRVRGPFENCVALGHEFVLGMAALRMLGCSESSIVHDDR